MRKVLLGALIVSSLAGSKKEMHYGQFYDQDKNQLVKTYYQPEDGIIVIDGEEWMYAEYGTTAAMKARDSLEAHLLTKH